MVGKRTTLHGPRLAVPGVTPAGRRRRRRRTHRREADSPQHLGRAGIHRRPTPSVGRREQDASVSYRDKEAVAVDDRRGGQRIEPLCWRIQDCASLDVAIVPLSPHGQRTLSLPKDVPRSVAAVKSGTAFQAWPSFDVRTMPPVPATRNRLLPYVTALSMKLRPRILGPGLAVGRREDGP